MFCPECGKAIHDDSRFCEHCGNNIESDIPDGINTQNDKSAPVLTCPECGKTIPDDSMFCEHCGKNIDNDISKEISIKENEPVPNSIASSDIPENKQSPKVEYTTCRNCGDKIEGSSEYCSICKNIIAMKNRKVTPEQKPTVTPKEKPVTSIVKIIIIVIVSVLLLLFFTGLFYVYIKKSESDNKNTPIKTVVAPTQSSSVDEIEKHDSNAIDLLNITMPVSDDIRQTWRERYNLPTFTLKNGIFETGKENEPEGVIYEIDKNSIHYSDLDDDGTKEVIFQGHYQWKGANGDPSEIVIAKMQNSEIKIIERVTGHGKLQTDYENYYPNSMLWEFIKFKIAKDQIIFFALADGCHAAPDYIVIMPYILNGGDLKLIAKPQKTKDSDEKWMELTN